MKKLIIFILFTSLMSCKNTPDKWETKVKNVQDMLNSFHKEIEIKAEVFIDDSVHLSNPFTLKIIKNFLLIENMLNGDGKLISVYNMSSKQYVGEFLSKGRGPNEFLHVTLCRYYADTIMALDVFRKEAQLFSINKIQKCDQLPDRKFRFRICEKADQINQCLWLDDKLICSGQFMQGRVQCFDSNGRFIKYFGTYPKVSYNGSLDNYHLGYVYGTDTSFASNVKQDKFAFSERYAFCIYEKTQYSFNKLFEAHWNIPKIYEASYKNDKPYVVRSGDDMVGSGNIAASEKYFFAPFSEYNYRDIMKQGIENYYGYILVLDWNGNPIAKLKLDKEIHFPLEIDDKGKYLYSIHTDLQSGFSQIVRFNLSCLDYISN
jgi:hypothetical protein